ncbi:hypothetical protein [Microbacterium kunmingense]|uniref:hypothetical protein n=1 Tax=Microbacterium kunmingense TaxID=2915939 RepID=UPI003D736DD2
MPELVKAMVRFGSWSFTVLMSLFAAAVNTSGQALPRGEHYDVVVGASLTGLVATLLPPSPAVASRSSKPA